jgi:hypothetical protein
MLSNSKKWQQYVYHLNKLEQCLFLLFLDNLAVDLGFLTLQDKHNIYIVGKYKINLQDDLLIIVLEHHAIHVGLWCWLNT